MAGYKETVKDDGAVSLWSFDGDAFDPVTRKLLIPTGEPQVIIDEIDNQNPAILYSDHPLYLGYRLGMPSAVTHEQEDNQSITFGYYGKIPAHPNEYPKSYLEIPHTATYAFPLNEFTIEFFFKIDGNLGVGTYPIFNKKNVIEINYIVTVVAVYLSIIFLGTTMNINYNEDTWVGGALSGSIIHFAFTYGSAPTTQNTFGTSGTLYLNSRIVSVKEVEYEDILPNINHNTPILIGGTETDYWPDSLNLDQIAVYDRCLTENEIAKHVAKAFPYDELLKKCIATYIWPFSDTDSLVDFSIKPYYGTLSGSYVGGRGRCIRNVEGPSNIMNVRAATFVSGGQAAFTVRYYNDCFSPWPVDKYTFEWWFKTASNTRGVLFAYQSLLFPFDGVLVEMNVRNDINTVGSIQLTEASKEGFINSKYFNDSGNRYLLNDGKWHHIAITRRLSDRNVSLYIDGELNDDKILPIKIMDQPGQIVMMNSMPGNLEVNGSLSYLAYYPFDLQAHQIRSRFSYATIYRIRGIVTLLGIPHRATLRFYSSYTGEFIQELESDAESGEYSASFYTNSNIDILVFDPHDLSVRYRAYGPITPSEFDDIPISL